MFEALYAVIYNLFSLLSIVDMANTKGDSSPVTSPLFENNVSKPLFEDDNATISTDSNITEAISTDSNITEAAFQIFNTLSSFC